MSDRQQRLRRDILERNLAQIECERAREEIKNTSKYREIKKDNAERTEIQDTIERMAKEGKGKLEILAYLMNTYPDTEKSKYFGIWIHHKFKKLKINDDYEQEK